MKRFLLFLFLLPILSAFSQTLKVYNLNQEKIRIDGVLDEPAWVKADSISNLTMVEPLENVSPSFRTVVKVLADSKNIYIGVQCYDKHPDKITSYSKIRDSRLYSEDRIKFVFDTNLDERTGYIFAVNPSGTRYDALVSDFGEGENSSWDAIWDARTRIDSKGWTAEIVIPVLSLSFSDVDSWGFNIERKIQRKMETDRWTAVNKNYHVGQVIHAGRISGIPKFNIGIGLVSKFSGIAKLEKSYGEKMEFTPSYSLDFTQRISSDISAELTVNTDFAETEVDTRRTNLTRFPLFFPEKRSFFLEGADIFDFGIGLGHDIVPFFTRRIGLFKHTKVPLIWGTKINGRANNTNFGALISRTDAVSGLVPATTMGAFRVKQNIWKESSVGVLGTFGDPQGRENSWLLGTDFIYQTSEFMGDKNFLAGVWFLFNNRNGLKGDKSAVGFKIDYPNDLWDISLRVKRIGDGFEPSLGYVQRNGIISYHLGADFMPRPKWKLIRQFFFESGWSLITDLHNRWLNYYVFTAPVHFLLESGDRFEFNISPRGENLDEDFEISENVIIKPKAYHWWRYRLEFETASKRIINGQATWWFGSFYDGKLDQLEFWLAVRPSGSVNLSFNYERNIARLPEGNFTQDLFGGKLQFSFTPNFELSSFIQYDSESKSLGTNTRLRWTFSMLGDLFLVYNHNVNKVSRDVWLYDSNQFILKIRYGFWK
jgi:hypothetical protein